MDVIFSAVDLTTLSGGVITILVALIGVALLFVGYEYIMICYYKSNYYISKWGDD